jgi:hypothetical protein
MTDELVRAAAAVPVAVLLALAMPRPPGRRLRGALSALLVLAALAPHLGDWRTWLIAAAAAGAAALPEKPTLARPLGPLLLAAVALALAVLVTDPGAAWDAIEDIAGSRDVVLVTAGALTAVFLAGAVIGRILHPFAERVRGADDTPGMENAGRYIGWLERGLLYGLILVGSADAAALVIAAKSIARFPSFREEKFAEYYLIGTLLSLLTAAVIGFAVRTAMGLDPLD